MKTKMFFLSLLAVFIYFSCEDSSVSEIGTGIMPKEDYISIYEDSVPITLKTIQTDSIYAKTISGALGEYYDPTFGTLNAGFACQFYPSIKFENLENLVDGKIDSVFLDVFYSYMGDSLAPMELTAYPINKPLEKNYYTNVNPEEFADMAHPLTRFAYTTQHWNYTGYNYGMLPILMQKEWMQKYVDVLKKDTLQTLDEFVKMFPGLYLKSTYGSGCMLYIANTEIVVKYRTKEPEEAYEGGDSIRTRYAYWAVTKEVIQLNSYKNTNIDYLFKNDSTTYLKSPAGVFTEVTIPIPEIMRKVGKRQFSSVKFSLKAYPRDEWNYSLSFPGLGDPNSTYISSKLLLVSPDSVKNFFEQQQVADNKTAYSTTFASSNYTYNFTNISNLIRYAIDNKPTENLKLWLIPVRVNYNTSYVEYATSYDLYPTGVALKSNDQQIRIIASDLEINK